LTVSSLRFLEKEGLVTPERTAGGHRRYTQADVERVRFIKEMQRRFFPLIFRPLHYDPDFVPLSRAELAQVSGLDEDRLVEMESLRMITTFDEAQDGPLTEGKYDEDDLRLAKAMKGLAHYGLKPSDLAFYMEHIENMVEQEMWLMISKVMAERSLDEMDTVAVQVEELNDEIRRTLHAKVMRQAAYRLSDRFKKQPEEGE